ncbi:hypothetical protein [Dyadobacter fanqingshengii]|uniref:Uncharacterized protein n=1 Tax=Dyadobacter fanqingshengii TaxID=2906443 RepID=A0A9X1P6S8_9BACT|nr:hypothetical protein [Dyadobacter fanqingshengii]MCF0039796.1 hypothetical protein [Dyadobacter fanqingshengii]USJ38441.1 hypothetical protein NFI81_11800 [Dyadobacter fanqingshengii]
MKQSFTLLLLLFICSSVVRGQKAKDILEDGIPVQSDGSIFIKFSDNSIKYYAGDLPKRSLSIKDSIIFLPKNSSINVFIKPLNPLNFSFNSETKIVIDQIDADAANAQKSILELNSKFNGAAARSMIATATCPFGGLESSLKKIKDSLEVDTKPKIVKLFKSLKGLSFNSEDQTISTLNDVEKQIDDLDKHYKRIVAAIATFRDDVKNFTCPVATDNPFIIKYIFDQLAAEAERVQVMQYRRVNNLKRAYDIVKKAQVDASEEKDGLRWCTFVKEVEIEKGKISIFTITIYKSGFRLSNSDDESIEVDEIIENSKVEVTKATIRFRRFQRFVPEVSAGVAYVDLSYPKYGIDKDAASNEQRVVNSGNDNMKRINITGMINYNYFIQNSQVHPFVQLGAGANIDFPVLLIGGGLRFNFVGGSRLAFAGGIASSWIKSLDKLKLGSVVNSQADLDSDIRYQFAKPKVYFGVQFGF